MKKHLLALNCALKVPPLNWVIFILIGWVYIIYTADLEGKYLPAAEPIFITKIEPTNARTPEEYKVLQSHVSGKYTAIWIRSKRLRPACGPNKLEWFLGKRNRYRVGAPVVAFWGPPRNHPNGVFESGPWIVQIPVKYFFKTHADVLHICTFIGLFKRKVRTPLFN